VTDRIEVLHDGGFVRLVDHMGNDLSIVRAARVSYNADWRAGEDEDKDKRLVGYLWRNKHTSPFEAVTFTFEIKCPIFIRGQWHRHRTWAYNEISARYAPLDEGHYTPKPEMIGVQSAHNKQMRDLGELDSELMHRATAYTRMIYEQNEKAFETYRYLLDQGVPRELARSVLPLASYTRFFGTVNLRNLFHFLDLRLHPHAQLEMQKYAQALLALIRPVVPVAWQAYMDSPK
jgi:thymidylate synthase (FAD)